MFNSSSYPIETYFCRLGKFRQEVEIYSHALLSFKPSTKYDTKSIVFNYCIQIFILLTRQGGHWVGGRFTWYYLHNILVKRSVCVGGDIIIATYITEYERCEALIKCQAINLQNRELALGVIYITQSFKWAGITIIWQCVRYCCVYTALHLCA